MLYEFRTYHINEGKMPDIHKRFEQTTLTLFAKHGIHVCDFWTDAEDKNAIYYICAFESMEERNKAFDAFRVDPIWVEVFAASNENGVIVDHVDSHFMTRVPYITPNWK